MIIVPLIGLTLTFGLLARVAVAGPQSAPAMTVEQTQATMDGYFEALLDGGAYEAFFADDIVVTMVGSGQEITGPAAAKEAIDALHHDQFDAAPEITNLVIGPGRAALEAEFIGVHTGQFGGLPRTGKQVDVPYSVFYELKDGKITALRIYGLVDGLVRQLTAVQKM
jgi:predicted ester cyclase